MHRLANFGIQFFDFNESRVVVMNEDESSLVLEVKRKIYHDLR